MSKLTNTLRNGYLTEVGLKKTEELEMLLRLGDLLSIGWRSLILEL